MYKLRLSKERGYFENNWLKSFHTFSFGEYFDRKHLHYRTLRVINEDWVLKSSGFPTHPHKDMEIITYVLSGAVAHKDSLGSSETIPAGDVQVMTAGSGITHSEFNPSNSEDLHLLQIWIVPNTNNLTPSYSQKSFSPEEKLNKLKLIASHDGEEGTLYINQDAKLYASILEAHQLVTLKLNLNRGYWVQVASGEILVNDIKISSGDGLAIDQEQDLKIVGSATRSEFLLFDLN